MIYLDYNATTPVDKDVVEYMLPYFQRQFGNPSSSYELGTDAAAAIYNARTTVARCLEAANARVVFTSGATEANNLAIKGAASADIQGRRHIIISSIEHPSVSAPVQFLKRNGYQVTTIQVDSVGRVNPLEVKDAITSDTFLISIMLANNETGTIQPIADIGRIAKEHNVLMHTDAAQATGKMNVNFQELNVDMMSIAGHKFYAPKGVGALLVGPGVILEPLLHGAGHESGQRAGTENTPLIVALGNAVERAVHDAPAYKQKVQKLRDSLEENIRNIYPPAVVNGGKDRLCNTLNVSFPGLDYKNLLENISKHIACSAGSACHSGNYSGSPVLQAMGLAPEIATSAIRFSLGKDTTEAEITSCLRAVKDALQQQ
jgi:cysteine desulfurase